MAFDRSLTKKLGLDISLPDPKDLKVKGFTEWFQQEMGDNGMGLVSDSFLNWAALDGRDYAKNYGYEFVIFDAISGAVYHRLAMPLNPQSIQLEIPAAVNLTVTQKGIVEEHNGAPLRRIAISGTSGTLPGEALVNPVSQTNNALDYVFKNTIQQVGGVVRQAQRVANTFSGGSTSIAGPLNYSLNQIPKRTGYWFIHTMARFFDFYMAMKKSKEGHNWRLGFNMYKDQMYYDVTLQNYSIQKQAGTIEYLYGIQLTAWKRRAQPIGGAREVQRIYPSQAEQLNIIARIVNGLKQVRRLIARSYGVMSGIRADIDDSLIKPIRETVLIAKDTVNLAYDMYDFGFSGTNSFWAGARESFISLMDEATQQSRRDAINDTIAEAGLYGEGDANTIGGGALTSAQQERQGNSTSDLTVDTSESSNPINNLFSNPIAYPDVFEGIGVDELPLSDVAVDQINAQIEEVRQIDAEGLRQRRDLINSYAASISAALGGSSETYNRIKGLAAPKKNYRKLTVDDITLLSALNDAAILLDKLINVIGNTATSKPEDYYSFYERYALSSGLLFNKNASKFLVPFPVGGSLESLAVQYLGNVDRWIEIAALNGLKAPYVDEEGVLIPFTGSGSGNSFTVASADNLYVGQLVRILSDTKPAIVRRIDSIQQITTVETLVAVDGDPTIGQFKVSQNAKMLVYRPNTVNSFMLIAIPSDQPTQIEGRIKVGVDVNDINGLAEIAKTDFLLDSQGDIIFGKDDVKLAVGLPNLIQAAILKVRTAFGSMLQHPTYGNPVQAGDSTANMDVQTTLTQLTSLFNADPRFSGVQAATIKKNGPSVEISILVGIAGTDINLPLSVQLPVAA